jgi:hypothetical protein
LALPIFKAHQSITLYSFPIGMNLAMILLSLGVGVKAAVIDAIVIITPTINTI